MNDESSSKQNHNTPKQKLIFLIAFIVIVNICAVVGLIVYNMSNSMDSLGISFANMNNNVHIDEKVKGYANDQSNTDDAEIIGKSYEGEDTIYIVRTNKEMYRIIVYDYNLVSASKTSETKEQKRIDKATKNN